MRESTAASPTLDNAVAGQTWPQGDRHRGGRRGGGVLRDAGPDTQLVVKAQDDLSPRLPVSEAELAMCMETGTPHPRSAARGPRNSLAVPRGRPRRAPPRGDSAPARPCQLGRGGLSPTQHRRHSPLRSPSPRKRLRTKPWPREAPPRKPLPRPPSPLSGLPPPLAWRPLTKAGSTRAVPCTIL